METAPLKSFATWARTALIREVTARIAVVLAPASSERVEQAKAVAALEKAVAAAGDGENGHAAVADKVAYTWFNRIIALRFMDANGYTGVGVVSPQAGVGVGQPEILADAKRGVIDSDVVSQQTRDAVTALLNGIRQSGDPQAEAYALLLEAYCNYWHMAMPFMFEGEGDFTELLIPANLLADDSVLNRSVKVLTKDVCKDVEVIGWLYQFYISERKDEVFAGFKKNKKAGADEIPAATQLFTPHWIVRYLVENSLGRLWMLNRPSSGLVNQMDYYIAPLGEETDFLKITGPEELKIIDPACGSGHMLTYAFDLLYAVYEEEGYSPADIPGLILANNLYGTEIDPRAGALAAFALTMKARAKQRNFFNRAVEPNVCVLEPVVFTPQEFDILLSRSSDEPEEISLWNQFEHSDTLGALIRTPTWWIETAKKRISATGEPQGDLLLEGVLRRARRVVTQAEFLSPRYNVLVANPPYMGSGNMGATLSEFARVNYPTSKSDLMTMFMERGQSLLISRGEWAMINLPTWTFLASSAKLRATFLLSNRLRSMVLTGRGVFGSDFGAVAFVTTKVAPLPETRAVYRKLTTNNVEVRSNDAIRKLFLDHGFGRFELAQSTFLDVPGSQIAFGLAPDLLRLFTSRKPLGTAVQIRAGISTGDNSRFVRFWHEISRTRIHPGRSESAPWKPHNKGGAFRRWYGNIEHVLRYNSASVREMDSLPGFRHDGRDVYFEPHVSWSEVTSGRPSFRSYPPGMTFGSGSKAIVGDDQELMATLAYLNSAAVEEMLGVLSPGMKTEVGHIAGLPGCDFGKDADDVAALARRATNLAKVEWDSVESSMDFGRLPLVETGETSLPKALSRVLDQRREVAAELGRIDNRVDALVWKSIGRQVPTVDGSAKGEARRSPEDVLGRDPSLAADLVSYFVGCLFGRYSLNEPGLILADQGATLQDYLAKVSTPCFMPDADNVIPIVDGDWFEDDIVERFRQFLRVAFGEEHFEENLQFVMESLGAKNLRDYFVKSFYKDHVQRYKKRPIYWLFSSPKGSFNALIYMHRYTPSTVSTVLNEYLREFQAKIKASLEHAERANNAKEADRLRKVLLELDEYEHDVLYPLASQQIAIDLDDGVKVNYPKFGAALKKIPGLEGDA
ncbi:BREX-1 system adenine-specific DNA-methyltransferase PglX [Pseudarthrobacter sp. AB1]|uniref:BREX-1 system adenine-specific DNA-methyltransferase PglX n=1 Tax=Pseudarthrobacter sp. AB1 TaxID=2138309 RepID=UPI00186B6221|nr:BREX-1 system adenine-specific DNA-methyltransferase PglX [Pseudarthrobacter sp. AB1]MBE4717285.1 BREX-1 system adenine-specific DNA-methyltransferase PglX [Pseudarthrobacter sp. AB1]